MAVDGRANHRELLLEAAAAEGEELLQLRAMEEAAEAAEAAWQDMGEGLARLLKGRDRGLRCAEAWVEVQISVCPSAGSQAPRDVDAAAASASLNTGI